MTLDLSGSQKGGEIKTFNEKYETDLWRVVSSYIKKEKRVDGKVAYVVGDVGSLIIGIMEFYEKRNK